MKAAIHINPRIDNQVVYGHALAEGFRQHGYKADLTPSLSASADVHCLIGPWYAYDHFKGHDKVLYLDRACWDHPALTCINWMSKGSKVWNWKHKEPGRYRPETKPWRDGNRLIILCDYGEDSSRYENRARPYMPYAVRRHPSQTPQEQELTEQLKEFDCALGGKSTALVTAAVEGLSVFSVDKLSPVYPISQPFPWTYHKDREGWLNSLSWHNWTPSEIASGAAWEHFRQF